MKKKIIAMLLTLTMCVGLSACGNGSDRNSERNRDASRSERIENTSEETKNQTESDTKVADAQKETFGEDGLAEVESLSEEEKNPNGYINDEGYFVFGRYELDNDESNGPEPIEWVILDENENGTLLISRYVLDAAPYNDNYEEEVTWETCSLREWLNNDFYDTAFDDEMKLHINTVTLVNDDNQMYGTSGGNDTSDKIFILSVSEILKYYDFNVWYTESEPFQYHDGRSNDKYEFGFCEDLITQSKVYGRLRGADNTEITEYHYNQGLLQTSNKDTKEDVHLWVLSEMGYSDTCIGKLGTGWWLRSPGISNTKACYVDCFGEAGANCYDRLYDSYGGIYKKGVRPALYINK